MFLLVRDEDGPTVASAIHAFADEGGLEPIDLQAGAGDPFAMLSVLTGPRVLLAPGDAGVAVFGLETLDLADAEEWGSEVSAACETEVIALEIVDGGVRVHVYDGGEPDEVVDVAVDPSGRTRAPGLVDFVDTDEGRRELEGGVAARSPVELASGILRCFGVTGAREDAIQLAFVDPRGDEDDEGPHLEVMPVATAPDPAGLAQAFAVTLRGIDAIDGVHLELSGNALDLLTIHEIEAFGRVRGEREPAIRTSAPGETALHVADAHLERVDLAPPPFDLSDMFATMQALVRAGDTQQENTLFVTVRASGRAPGRGTLVLTARADNAAVAAAEAEAVIEVQGGPGARTDLG